MSNKPRRITDALCFFNIHAYRWHFVGTSWTPDAYARHCKRCGLAPGA